MIFDYSNPSFFCLSKVFSSSIFNEAIFLLIIVHLLLFIFGILSFVFEGLLTIFEMTTNVVNFVWFLAIKIHNNRFFIYRILMVLRDERTTNIKIVWLWYVVLILLFLCKEPYTKSSFCDQFYLYSNISYLRIFKLYLDLFNQIIRGKEDEIKFI